MVNLGQCKLFAYQGGRMLVALVLVGCAGPFDRKIGLKDLDHPNVAVKIVAIKKAGDSKASSAVPQLVDFLQNEDVSVRFYSIEALRRITGTDCGYDYKAAPHVRAAAVRCWQDFIHAKEF